MIEELKENEIFIFGSNLNGNHAGGSARLAQDKFGAVSGTGEGLTGKCYAFPTLDRKMQKQSMVELRRSAKRLFEVAEKRSDKVFLLTKVGCGIAGFSEEEIKPLFKDAPKNIIKPIGW